MKLVHPCLPGALIALMLFPEFGRADSPGAGPAPKFDEIYQLLRTNLTGSKPEDIDRAAVKGLLEQFPLQVRILGESDSATALTGLTRSLVYDGECAYLRVSQVGPGLVEGVTASVKDLGATNQLKGIILDLRFASGTDFESAAKVVDLFTGVEKLLLSWGEQSVKSRVKADYIKLPLAVLVNKETSGAAEALAAALQETQAGLLLGSGTAGQASVFKEFKLASGQRLLIAAVPVKLGNGESIAAGGLKPDIEIRVDLQQERAYLEDPFKSPTEARAASTNQLAQTESMRRRINEAELVRRQREGLNPDDETTLVTAPKTVTARPSIKDPVLARAIDVLKAIAVVQRVR
ncbi:MAG: hypothetical protein H7X97_11390 [Opitutaceae bacterium]|nr:hypothetical protein [Verrucomicrobiales bacterium]